MKKALFVLLSSALLCLAACGEGDGGTGNVAGDPPQPPPPPPPPVDDVVVVKEDIKAATTWTADKVYALDTEIYVKDGAVLTIEAGTTVVGESGSALIVTTTGTINATGTKDKPIVFTSSRPDGSRDRGDWGGVVLLGKSTLSWGTDDGGVLVGQVEGLDPSEGGGQFGGTDETHDCGTLRYVRIEYAGFKFGTDNELNGLTVAGCGTDTDLSYIQVHRGLDDAVEFFGGTASIDHVIADGMGDDGLDWDQGWRGIADYVIIHHYQGNSDDPRGIEADNFKNDEDAEPRSQPNIRNATIVASPGSQADQGILLRRGTFGHINNAVVTGFEVGFDIRAEETAFNSEDWPSEIAISRSYLAGNTSAVDEKNEDSKELPTGTNINEVALVEQAERNNDFTTEAGLGDVSGAANGGTPNYSTTVAAGAIPSGTTDWTTGWTSFPKN